MVDARFVAAPLQHSGATNFQWEFAGARKMLVQIH